MTEGSSEEEFLLKWHDHHTSFFLLVEELVTREQLTDVTLSCGDMILNAHSLMLSVCSPYFRSLLSENQHREKHHIIHLNGVPGRLMQQLLVYMYRGEISISQDDLGPLIETARCLQIKGLSMANSDVDSTKLSSKKRSASQSENPLSLLKSKERKLLKKASPVKSGAVSPSIEIKANTDEEFIKDEEEYSLVEYPEYSPVKDSSASSGKELATVGCNELVATVPVPKEFAEGAAKPSSGVPSNMVVTNQTLPLLPKPLSILKTAETRTYLSKLIWLGNGGKRPQYGNPETKPMWWPQHVLPWEEMKKMGGRKSQELSHINYTEILKQCLAAGYEYFGYDPSTYFSTEPPEIQMSDISYSSIEDQSYEDFTSSSTPNNPSTNLAITHSSSVNHGSGATTTPCSMEVDSSDGMPTIANICGSTGSTGAAGGAGRGRSSSGSAAGGLVMMADNSSGSDCETECEPALQIDLNPGAAGHGGAERKSNRLECDKDQILCK